MLLKFAVLFVIIFKFDESNGLRCYVCSDEENVPCLNFDSEKNKYIQQCDDSQKGCFLKIDGNNKTRSCFDKQINDCKMANGVEYCFCSSDLCNFKSNTLQVTTDDEDLTEGSGAKTIVEITQDNSIHVQKTNNNNTPVVHINSSANIIAINLQTLLIGVHFFMYKL